MILENSILEEIKQKANLSFDKAKDFSILSDIIFKETNRMIGVTSLKDCLVILMMIETQTNIL